MKPVFKRPLLVGLILIAGYSLLWIMSKGIGWYGYEQWKYRHGTTSIDEAKRRKVFSKELNFKVENYSGELYNFKPYVEKGFTFGHHSSEVTVPIKTDFPYQLSFDYTNHQGFGIFIKEQELSKFDSAGAVWGYLRQPFLKDTVVLEIRGEGIHSGEIKVW